MTNEIEIEKEKIRELELILANKELEILELKEFIKKHQEILQQLQNTELGMMEVA